jgi:hypothetical protein
MSNRGIMLSSFEILMTKHSTHRFNRNAIAQCDGCCECMSRRMGGDVLRNFALPSKPNLFVVDLQNIPQ